MKKLCIIITISLLLISNRVCGQDIQVDEQQVVLSQKDSIFGKLLCPKTEHPCPIVLIIAGSGPTDMDGNSVLANRIDRNNSLKFLAEKLAKAGIASLRYDKRGVASSAVAGLKETDLRFDHYIADAVTWLKWLEQHGGWSDIYVVGHSEGALIGMIAAQKYGAASGYVSLAGAGRPAYQVIEEQLAQQPQEIRNQVATYNSLLRMGLTIKDVPGYLQALYRPSVQPYLISWFKYNPQTEIARLKVPVLIVQGDTDIQVSLNDAHLLKEALTPAQLSIISGMNHVLKSCDSMDSQAQLSTYTNPNLPLHKDLVPTIVGFIEKNNTKHP